MMVKRSRVMPWRWVPLKIANGEKALLYFWGVWWFWLKHEKTIRKPETVSTQSSTSTPSEASGRDGGSGSVDGSEGV